MKCPRCGTPRSRQRYTKAYTKIPHARTIYHQCRNTECAYRFKSRERLVQPKPEVL